MLATSLFLLFSAQADPGIEAFSRGDYLAAERELKSSSDSRAKIFLALTFAATNRCDQATGVLKGSAETSASPTQRLAGLALVQCHLTASRFNDASQILTRLKSQYPTDADVLYLEARFHMRAWNESLRDLYRNAAGSYRVNQISGEILETQGQFAAAAGEYRKALEKNPDAVSLHFRLGRALLMSSHSSEMYGEATKEFEAELAKNPRDAVAHYEIAQILLALDKQLEAGSRLELALSIDDKFPEALIALGKMRVAQKRNEDAITLLSKAAELQPKNETAHYNLMLALRNAGRLDDAKREKAILDSLQKPPEGEFTDFLKKLGEKPSAK